MRAFCTYFDHRYLTRGLALWESLGRHMPELELHVLCLDDLAFETLQQLALPHLHPIRLAELEAHDRALAAVKPTRSAIEYYFTATPSLPLFVLARHPGLESITYLDADLWFFDSIEPLFAELGSDSVGIIRHRFPPELAGREIYGIFNVGCLVFRNDPIGRAVLQWWRARCLEWCYDRVDGDRFADQKYLDRWPELFTGVRVLEHKGANVAPWNVQQYALSERGGRVFVDDAPLLFYHFHGVRHWGGAFWRLGLADYKADARPLLVERVYRPYVRALRSWTKRTPLGESGALPRRGAGMKWPQLVKAPYYLLRRELVHLT